MLSPRIIGIVQCKDEWGLIGVAITHALISHVDEVHVIDDGSSDRSAAGFDHLRLLWGDRLRVHHLQLAGFHQEAVTNTVISLIAPSERDWIYVFDADEFLLTDDGRPLRALIDALDPEVGTIVYPLDNFIAPADFDPDRLSAYRALHFRAMPTAAYDFRSNQAAIREGRATFFDVPFLTKVIYRYSERIRIKAGSHNLLTIGREAASARPEGLRGGHLPFPALDRLERKARMGEHYVRSGRRPSQGWQNRLIYELREEGQLDWFWQRHSIGRDRADEANPAHDRDDRLTVALEPALATLARHFGSDDLRMIGDMPLDGRTFGQSSVPLGDVVRVVRTLQAHSDHLIDYAQLLRKQLDQR